MPPLISVILPVWNGARFLAEAIASIRAQNDPHLEIILVDDGSTDQTAAMAAGFPDVRNFHQANQGPAAARNLGLAEAGGELIAFLDVDDLWPAGKLACQRAHLEANPTLDAVLGRVQYVSLEGALELPTRFEGPDRTVSNVHLGCGLYRRKVFDALGGFDPSLRFSEDQDWFLRAREAGRQLMILEEVTLLYRLHGGNMTRGRGLEKLQVMAALRKSIARRRQTGQQDLGRWSDFDARTGPAVSVVVPVFNGERFLAEALQSVAEQEFPKIEIIVVDDGSTDQSRSVAARFPRVRLAGQQNAGVAAARNHGVRLARGELIAFLDQDDLWSAGVLGRLVGELSARPDWAVLMGRQQFFLEPGTARPNWLRPEILDQTHAGYALGAILARREVFDRTGPFDESLRTASDVDWFFRAKDLRIAIGHTGEVVLRHRIHETNQSNCVEEQHREYVRLVHRSMQRMRKEARA